MDLLGLLVGLPVALGLLALGLWLVGRVSREQGRRGPGDGGRPLGRRLVMILGGILGNRER